MKINCYTFLYELIKNKWFPNESLSSSIINLHGTNFKPNDDCTTLFRIHGRSLHYSLKIGDRKRTIKFYRDILGMKILRHEESGDSKEIYEDDRWSKTMVGYGPEDDFFAFELIYNYPLHNYLKGNEFICVTIKSREIIKRAKLYRWPILDGNVLEAPGGYRFRILDEPQPIKNDPILKITLACYDYRKSLRYWHNILGMILYERDNRKRCFTVGFRSNDFKLEFQQIQQRVRRGDESGRIYFSCPYYQQPEIAERIREKGFKILVPLMPMENPDGKCNVRILILSDPDRHEVCFVDDLAFRQISQYSPENEELLNRFIEIETETNLKIGEFKNEIKQIQNTFQNFTNLLPIRKVISRSDRSYTSETNSSLKPKETNYGKTLPQKLTVRVSKTNKRKSNKLSLKSKKKKYKEQDEKQEENSSNKSYDSKSTVSDSGSSASSYKSKLDTREDIEDFVKSVMGLDLDEKISLKVHESVQKTVSKVLIDKINDTVNKVVTEKIVETVAKAVAQLEESMKMNEQQSRLLPVIQEETEIAVHSFPCLNREKETKRIQKRNPRRFVNRRGRISSY